MTITLFLIMFTCGAAIATVLTEALKKAVSQKLATNVLALMVAAVVGIGGTATYYYLSGIPFTGQNVVCQILMTIAIWLGSMVGYDKVKQLIEQIVSGLKNKNGDN